MRLLPLLSLALLPQATDSTIPADAKVLREVMGDGVQIYHCASQGTGYAWVFDAPEATLLDDATHEQLGRHSAGPTWTWNDGSSVRGAVLAKMPSPEPDSIPWLLLQAVPDPSHNGLLSSVKYIRRSGTRGGNAPSTGCDATHFGVTTRIHYTAKYTFYNANGPL